MLLAGAVPSQARRDPGLDWRVLETPHFEIIYPSSAAATAARAAETAEDVHSRVGDLLGYTPPGRTPLVLNPCRDETNGYAQAVFRKLELYLTPPSDYAFGADDPPWLEYVLLHECAHLCHGLREEGFTRVLTTLCGEVNAVNFIAPRWWVEGVAVWAETELSRGGRGRSPYRRMLLAANLLSDRPWSLAQIGNDPRHARPAERVYVPGYDLLAEAREASGDDRWLARISGEQSAWPWFGLGDVWVRAVGLDPAAAWERLRTRARAELPETLGPPRPPAPEAFTLTEESDDRYLHPRWLDDGWIVAYRDSLDRAPGLVRLGPWRREEKLLFEAEDFYGGWAWETSTGRFVYARRVTDPVYSDRRLADLFTWSPGEGERRVTRGARCWSPDVGPHGRWVCARHEPGGVGLALVSPDTGTVTPVPLPPGTVCQQPRWSPDGALLAAAVRRHGRQDVCLVNPENGALTPLTGWDRHGDYAPAWSPDGRYLAFVSDRSGTYQIWVKDLETGSLYRASDARLGAFDPAFSADGKQLLFSEHNNAQGRSLVLAASRPEPWIPAVESTPEPDANPEIREATEPALGRPYSAWPHLLPSFWLPAAYLDEGGWQLGAVSGRQDPLELHAWWAECLVRPETGRVYGSLQYLNRDTPLTLSTRFFSRRGRRQGLPENGADAGIYAYRATGGSVQAALPLVLRRGGDWIGELYGEVNGTWFETRTWEGLPVTGVPAEFRDGAVGRELGWSAVWRNLLRRRRDLFPTAGVEARLRGRTGLSGGDFTGRRLSGGWDLHLPGIRARHALRARIRAGWQQGILPDSEVETAPRTYGGGQFNFERTAMAGLAYRLPLAYLDDGPGLFPVFFDDLWLQVVAEWGLGWQGAFPTQSWVECMVSVIGAELQADMRWFWYVPANVQAGMFYRPREREGIFHIGINLTGIDSLFSEIK